MIVLPLQTIVLAQYAMMVLSQIPLGLEHVQVMEGLKHGGVDN